MTVVAVTLVLLLVISDALRMRIRARAPRRSVLPAPQHSPHALELRAATSSEPPSTPDLSPQFEVWEAEEMEEQRREAEAAVLAAKASGTEDELPEYMVRLLQQFDDTGSMFDDSPPVQASRLPIIAVIGRPNTGKSTIVNRLSNSFKDGAIVHDEPGITRDRTYRVGMWNDYNFQVVDTGGIVFDDVEDIFADKITQQALLALGEATAAMMVCDGKEGVNPLDLILADWLRKNNKIPLYLAVNKCESETQGIAQAQDFWSLGLGAPHPVSGIHGTGLGDLLDEMTVTHLKKVTKVQKENATNIAFIGRPNVGKSSLFNRLLGVDRSIVSDIAGTTRDTVDALVHRGDTTYRIVDTAGVRKKGKIEYGAEFFMVNRAFKAVKRAEVVVLLLGTCVKTTACYCCCPFLSGNVFFSFSDATDGIVEQDRILAERIAQEGRSCVIALNKWDIVPEKDDKTYLKAVENVRVSLPALRWDEVALISAKTGQRTEKLFEAVDRAAKQFSRRIPTAIINEVVQDATAWMAPPTVGSRAGRIYYCIQTSTAPPTIVVFCNDPALFTDNYQRFLERKIRDALDFEGTPIKMIFRGKTIRDVGRAVRKGETATTRITGGGSVRDAKSPKRFTQK